MDTDLELELAEAEIWRDAYDELAAREGCDDAAGSEVAQVRRPPEG